MALDVTVAGATADSYLSLVDADAYAAADLGRNVDQWRRSTTDAKEAALRRATRDLDEYIGRVSALYSVDAASGLPLQALLFPRAEDVDLAGLPYIPEGVRRATYVQAVYVLRNADAIDDAASREAQGLSSFANPDGTGGTVSTDYRGALAPRARSLLGAFTAGSVIAQIVVR